ncbi:DUF927 domain-containing protein [Buttiauxella gaviniae]|uniref:DUF927 domain-containing protein n=1 Tax=Buttiauxella gaviniae TaxID=82990 RepID=UPI0039AFD3CB
MITNEDDFYINEEDLSKDGVLLLQKKEIQDWYEDNEYVVNTLGVFQKEYTNDDDDGVLLNLIHDFPICIYRVLEKAQTSTHQGGYTNTNQFVTVKYKVAGSHKDKDGNIFSRFKTSIMPTNEATNMNSSGGRFESTHLANGWIAPTLRKNKTVIATILQRMLDRSSLVAAYNKTGWQYDSTTNKTVHVTPSHKFFLGARNYSYLAVAGDRKLWIDVQIKSMQNSPLYTMFLCAVASSFIRGLTISETVSHMLVIFGKRGLGKTTIIQMAMSFFSVFSSKQSNISNAIEGSSSLPGTESLIEARNNATLGINEVDTYVKKNGIDPVVGLMNGGNRVVKDLKSVDGVTLKIWNSLFLGTANERPSAIAATDLKNEAFISRILELNIEDPVIHRFVNGKNGFDIHKCEYVLLNNYGHGYPMLMEYLDNEENKEKLLTFYDKTRYEYTNDQKLKELLGEGETRLMDLFAYITTGSYLIDKLFNNDVASMQVQESLKHYISTLSGTENTRNPKNQAIDLIKQLKHNIVMHPRLFIWEDYAYDRDGKTEYTKEENQTRMAKIYSNDSTQKIGIIRQNKTFSHPYDFNGEILLNINAKNSSIINFGNAIMKVDELISAVKLLDMCHIEKNGAYTKKVLTKKTSLKERSYFENIPKDVLRIKISSYEELEEEAEKETKEDEFENSAQLNKEIDEISKVANRKVEKTSKDNNVIEAFEDMLAMIDKKEQSSIEAFSYEKMIDSKNVSRINREEYLKVFNK